jgi:predicted dehydrogenase
MASTTSVFRIALIGGGIISRAHIAAAKGSGGRVQIVASVDPSEAARQSLGQHTGAPVFAHLDELLGSEVQLDGMIVCTPPSIRIDIVRAALARNIAVLVEKPLAHTLADARSLARLADEHPTVATAVGYCHRFVPAVVEMKRRIDAGELGELVRFENTFASWFPAMRERWMSDPAVSGGGSFIDTGCHSLDLFQHLVGNGEVAGAVFQHAWSGKGESSATVLLRGNGVAGLIESGWLEPARFTLTVVGTRGMLGYDYERPTELTHRPSEGPPQVVSVGTHETRFERQMLEFAKVARGGSSAVLARFADGLRVAEMVDSVQRTVII